MVSMKKLLNSFLYSFYVRILERTYKDDGYTIRYLLRRKRSSSLLVVFSGFGDDKPKYNYMRTLSKAGVNQLFILDDMGRKDYPGVYYLGENGDYRLKESVMNLIKSIRYITGSNGFLYTAGSSKGGWSALYFGLKMHADDIICGAPQYYLGSYLDCDFHRKTYEIITGEDKEKDKECLNSLLPEEIMNCDYPCNIHLHFSDQEHTFFEHVKYLDEDIKGNRSIKYDPDRLHYNEHSMVGSYFSKYLVKIINELN